MPRTTWIDEDKRGQDLRTEDLSYGYFLRCRFNKKGQKATKFGNILNATFVDCNLSDSDWTEARSQDASLHNCQTEGIVLPTASEAAALAIAQGVQPHFSQVYMAALFQEWAQLYPGARLLFNGMAERVFGQPRCYADFSDEFVTTYAVAGNESGWHRVRDFFSQDDALWQLWPAFVVPLLVAAYPNIPEEEWMIRA